MKKYLLIIALAVMGLTGCNKLVEAVDPIVGQWHCYSFDCTYSSNSFGMAGQTLTIQMESVFVFKANHTGTHGTDPIEWKRSGDTLITNIPNYTTTATYTIEELDHDKLVLVRIFPEYSWRFVLTRDK